MRSPTSRRAVLMVLATLVLCGAAAAWSAAATARGYAASGCSTAVQDASAGGAMGIEQSVAVDPLNPDNVLVGAIGADLYSSPFVSHDCGRTWSTPAKVGFASCTGDQSVAWDRHGNAYFSCDGTEVYHSSDAGDTWSLPVLAASPASNMGDAIDRPWLVVDNTGGPRDGTVYLVYESFFTNPLGWVFQRSSTDHGQTWAPAVRVDDPLGNTQSNPRNFPAMGADGTLYVVYAQGLNPFFLSQQNPINLLVARSTDGGATFSRVVAASGVTRNASPEDSSEIISSLAADPSPQRAGHLALAWADQRSGESRILVEDSVDGGATWSQPLDVDDDPPGKGNQHDHPQVVFLPDGRVAAVWRDRRCCGGAYTDPYQIFARVLQLGAGGAVTPGATTIQITDTSQAPNSSSMTNEYLGVSSGPEGLNVAWDQVVGGTPESVYRRLPLSALPAAPITATTPPAAPTRAGPTTRAVRSPRAVKPGVRRPTPIAVAPALPTRTLAFTGLRPLVAVAGVLLLAAAAALTRRRRRDHPHVHQHSS